MCLADRYKTILCARVAQLVEHDLAKVGAAGSSPVSRSSLSDGKLWFTRFSIFYCNAKINYTFLLITQCFFKSFLQISEWHSLWYPHIKHPPDERAKFPSFKPLSPIIPCFQLLPLSFWAKLFHFCSFHPDFLIFVGYYNEISSFFTHFLVC